MDGCEGDELGILRRKVKQQWYGQSEKGKRSDLAGIHNGKENERFVFEEVEVVTTSTSDVD